MKKRLLHLIATPREEESRTLRVTSAFLETFREKHPDWIIDELNVAKEELPSLTNRRVDGKYTLLEGKNLFGEVKEIWQDIIAHIERFKTADLFLVTTPMWNFSIPYTLKHYIDIIVQPKYLFQYKEDGSTEGLVKGKKMVVIASRGGQYEENSPFDLQVSYLKTIFGFVGITDITFIVAEPMDMGKERQQQKIGEAQEAARKLAEELDA